MGLVHEVAPRGEIVARAKAWIRGGGKAVAPWDEKGCKLPSGRVYSPQGMMTWPPANAIYRRETQDNYPAVKAILHAVYEGLQLPMDLALRVESRYFAKILRSQGGGGDDPHAVRLDAGAEQGRAPARRACRPATLKKIGVLGAGFMGAGIAYVAAQCRASRSCSSTATMEIGREGQGAFAQAHDRPDHEGPRQDGGPRRAARPHHAHGRLRALAGCDLVVEAVFEDPKVKAEAIAKAEAAIAARLHLRLQHLDAADHRARRRIRRGRSSSSASTSSRRSRR